MLQTHADGNALCLYLNLCLCQIAINVACGMACSEYYRSAIGLLSTRNQIHSLHAYHHVAIDNQARHLGLEVNLTSASYYRLAHILNHLRQLVGTDVRMSVGKD